MRVLYLACGMFFLAVGFVGVFVPLLPTTPFVLLATFFFSKSSERMHRWLIHHPQLGPPIREWQQYRVIRPRAKWLASSMITLVMSPTLIFGSFPLVLKLLMAATGVGVILLICSYPSQPAHEKTVETRVS